MLVGEQQRSHGRHEVDQGMCEATYVPWCGCAQSKGIDVESCYQHMVEFCLTFSHLTVAGEPRLVWRCLSLIWRAAAAAIRRASLIDDVASLVENINQHQFENRH